MITANENLLNVNFEHSGPSNNSLGMREMQARAYEKRSSSHLLIKAPPACGKSRALMYLALDKVHNQGCDKVIISVPQAAIGASFRNTKLTASGFYWDWEISPQYDLCRDDDDSKNKQKVSSVNKFIADPEAHFLVCTHQTLIFFYSQLEDKSVLNRAVIAIDEFHHVSVDDKSSLGHVVESIMHDTTAHIIAMTGSYFRGDRVPVLEPKDEALFDKVIYTYYEQFKRYQHLKSLGIDYAFYNGRWTDSVHEILDTTKKMMIFIPHPQSRESSKDKNNEVNKLLDAIGTKVDEAADAKVYTVRTSDGRLLKVADLVYDQEPGIQHRTLEYLRQVNEDKDAIDIIIAMQMAKEGFDWPWCEHVLTIGYRSSLTEVIQIIGRATRDAPGKEHAQYTNLIANPDASLNDVSEAVNSLLKAISISLLMEQVLAPNVHFRVRRHNEPQPDTNTDDEAQTEPDITFDINDDEKAPLTSAAKKILDKDIQSIVEQLLTSEQTANNVNKAMLCNGDGLQELLEDDIMPLLIRKMYPEDDLTDDDIHKIAKAAYIQLVLPALIKKLQGKGERDADDASSSADQESVSSDPHSKASESDGGNGAASADQNADGTQHRNHGEVVFNNALLHFADKLINVDDLDLNLILKITPFQEAHEFISRNLDAATLRLIQDQVISHRAEVTKEELREMWPKVEEFWDKHNDVDPNPHSDDVLERRLAEVLAFVRTQYAKRS